MAQRIVVVDDAALNRRVLKTLIQDGQGYLYGRPMPADDFVALRKRSTGAATS